MSASWACSALAALLLAGCGGGPELTAAGFQAGRGMTRVEDRRTGGSAEPVPTFRADGGWLTFAVQVRNTGAEPVTVTGPARDETGDDQQFVPEEDGGPVTVEAGATERLEVTGRTTCNGRMPGQLSGKNGQRFGIAGGGTVDVDLGALIEFVCPR